MPDDDFNEFLEMFINESRDLFERLDDALLEVEQNPADTETLYTVLRLVHSLKGTAGMVGYDPLQTLCHAIEDFMTVIHENPELVNREVMDLLFKGRDLMQVVFNRCSESEAQNDELEPEENAYLQDIERRMNDIMLGGNTVEHLLPDMLERIEELLETVESFYEVSPLRTLVKKVHKALERQTQQVVDQHAIEQAGQIFFGDREVTEQVATVRSMLADAEKGEPDAQNTARFMKQVEEILEAAQGIDDQDLNAIVTDTRESIEVFNNLDLDFDQMQIQYYNTVLKDLSPYWSAEQKQRDNAVEDGEKQAAAGSQVLGTRTVRISEGKIDTFLDRVGDMIILGEMYNHLHKKLAAKFGAHHELLREFASANNAYSTDIFSLQEALMEVRRVNLKNVTGTLARLVRDTSNKLGKNIHLEIHGENSVIDKSHLDDLSACLVHIVRNSIDHGMEMPDERKAVGKSPQGTIRIQAENEDGSLIIQLTDDGRGVNTAKIRKLAVERNVLSQQQATAASDSEINQLIFEDGFSTAKEVTDISGRGVGMSVVFDNIRSMGGSVHVESTPGMGVSVLLRIPLTIMLSVIDALIVRLGDYTFVLSLRNVVESFSAEGVVINKVPGRGECVDMRNEIHRFVRLDEHLMIPRSTEGAGVMILVSSESDRFYICVDEIMDHQQVVIKPIKGIGTLDHILGGALLGDGSIGLVLDIDSFELKGRRQNNTLASDHSQE
jgi:two-component system chemotaxis sensor kinase CheA